jgi:hypothetical protein
MDCFKWTQESKPSAIKAFKIDGLLPAAAIETYEGPKNTTKQVLSNVEIPRFGQHTIFIKLKIEELMTYPVNVHEIDGIGYGFTYKEDLSFVYCFAFTNA